MNGNNAESGIVLSWNGTDATSNHRCPISDKIARPIVRTAIIGEDLLAKQGAHIKKVFTIVWKAKDGVSSNLFSVEGRDRGLVGEALWAKNSNAAWTFLFSFALVLNLESHQQIWTSVHKCHHLVILFSLQNLSRVSSETAHEDSESHCSN